MESKTEDPLEVGKILVNLCTGDKYKILAVAKPRGQNEASSFTDFGQQESAQTRRSLSYAKTPVILLRQSANLSWTFGGHGLCARSS